MEREPTSSSSRNISSRSTNHQSVSPLFLPLRIQVHGYSPDMLLYICIQKSWLKVDLSKGWDDGFELTFLPPPSSLQTPTPCPRTTCSPSSLVRSDAKLPSHLLHSPSLYHLRVLSLLIFAGRTLSRWCSFLKRSISTRTTRSPSSLPSSLLLLREEVAQKQPNS